MKSEELWGTLGKALGKFEEALGFEDTEPLRESLIQRFEYTFELSWKLMSSILADEGMPVNGVRTVIRSAAKLGILPDPVVWLHYADARNKTSHLYKEEVARDIATVARGGFGRDVRSLLLQTRARMDGTDAV